MRPEQLEGYKKCPVKGNIFVEIPGLSKHALIRATPWSDAIAFVDSTPKETSKFQAPIRAIPPAP
jgi:hypothetical protein